MSTQVQVIFGIITALTALCGVVLGIINQVQLRRQAQRRLSVKLGQETIQAPRIPDNQGGLRLAETHVFTIHMVNKGLLPIPLKEAGLIGPKGKSLTDKFYAERRNKQFPLDLAPGDDLDVRMDAYEVLAILKGHPFSGKVKVRGYVKTPLKWYRSRKMRVDIAALSNEIQQAEGAWRK